MPEVDDRLEDRIRTWTDRASSSVAPVSPEEVWERLPSSMAVRRAGTVWRRHPVLTAAVVVPLLLAAGLALALTGEGENARTGLSSDAGEQDDRRESERRGPYDEQAQIRPDLMRVEPPEASPGDTVELHFPAGTMRGDLFVLEQHLGGGAWELRYWLPGGGWARPHEDFAVDAAATLGPGPDHKVIPDSAEPGEYRICTAFEGFYGEGVEFNYCAELTIR